jgi:glycosyltransferase involved in cell wall biosynthesis
MLLPPSEPGLVSIITPTYNRTSYLMEAVESALRQTYAHFEIIVSDDAGIEDVQAVLERFHDSRIRYRRNAAHLGQHRNVVAALAQARGEFFAYLHDDDRWEPDFLAKVVPPMLQDRGIALSFSDHYVMDEHGVVNYSLTERLTCQYGRKQLAAGLHRPFYALQIAKTIPWAMASVYRRHILETAAIPPEIGPCLDRWTGYLASQGGMGAYYTAERLTFYRVHSASYTASTKQSLQQTIERQQGHIYYSKQLLNDPAYKAFHSSLCRACSINFLVLANAYRAYNRIAEARSHYIQSLQWHPNLKSLAGLLLCSLTFLNGEKDVTGKRSHSARES